MLGGRVRPVVRSSISSLSTNGRPSAAATRVPIVVLPGAHRPDEHDVAHGAWLRRNVSGGIPFCRASMQQPACRVEFGSSPFERHRVDGGRTPAATRSAAAGDVSVSPLAPVCCSAISRCCSARSRACSAISRVPVAASRSAPMRRCSAICAADGSAFARRVIKRDADADTDREHRDERSDNERPRPARGAQLPRLDDVVLGEVRAVGLRRGS